MPKIPFYGSRAEVAAYEAQLAKWMTAQKYIDKSETFADAVNNRDWSNTIFNDSKAWIYAKVAVESNSISVDDYTTLMARRAIASDFKRTITDIEALSLDDELLRAYFAKQFRLVDSKESLELADDFIRYAKRILPANQCFCFAVSQDKYPGSLYVTVDRVRSRTIFFPERSTHNAESFTYMVPSYPVLKTFQDYFIQYKNLDRPDKAKLQNITLEVCEGKLDANDIAALHARSTHPASISTPYCKQTNADDHECGEYGFFWHDASFHWQMLTAQPALQLDSYVAKKMLAFYQSKTSHHVDIAFTKNSEIKQFEVIRRLTIAAIDLEIRSNKSRHHFGLPFAYIVKGHRSTLTHEENMKIYNPVLTHELLEFVVTSFIKDREELRNQGLEVEKIFKKMLITFNFENKERGRINCFSAVAPVYASNKLSPDDRAWMKTQLINLAAEIPQSKKMRLEWLKPQLIVLIDNIQAFLKTCDLDIAAQSTSRVTPK